MVGFGCVFLFLFKNREWYRINKRANLCIKSVKKEREMRKKKETAK